MKILLIHNYYRERGGTDTYVDMLMKLLQDNGHTVCIFSKNSASIENSFVTKCKTAIDLILGSTTTARELYTIVQDFRPDIAHIHNIYPLITDSIFEVLKQNSIPIVETVHTYNLLGPSGRLFVQQDPDSFSLAKALKWYGNSIFGSLALTLALVRHRKKHMSHIHMFIFPASFAKNIFINNSIVPRKKTIVIPHFSFPSKNKPVKKQEFFLYVGRLSKEKGIEIAIHAFNKIPDTKLVVIGTGPLEKKLKQQASSNTTFLGLAPEHVKNKCYQEALATIIPSAPLYEFGPLVLLESFAHGTPVIVPKVGVFLERVKQNTTGFFYKSGDLHSMLRVITNLSARPKTSTSLRPIIQKEYTNHFTPQQHYEKIMSVYNHILNRL